MGACANERGPGSEHLLEPPIILGLNTSRRPSGTTALVGLSSLRSTAGVNRPLTSPF